MPVAELDGLEIAYDVVGEGQPWILTPGGRFTKDVGGLPEMAAALAEHGRKVITWDRPNCGSSSVAFTGRSWSPRCRPTPSAPSSGTSTSARRSSPVAPAAPGSR